jgi:hypothetical protein
MRWRGRDGELMTRSDGRTSFNTPVPGRWIKRGSEVRSGSRDYLTETELNVQWELRYRKN